MTRFLLFHVCCIGLMVGVSYHQHRSILKGIYQVSRGIKDLQMKTLPQRCHSKNGFMVLIYLIYVVLYCCICKCLKSNLTEDVIFYNILLFKKNRHVSSVGWAWKELHIPLLDCRIRLFGTIMTLVISKQTRKIKLGKCMGKVK